MSWAKKTLRVNRRWSCTAEVEFEFTTWVWVQATTKNGDWRWLPLPIAILAVADPVFYSLFMYENEKQEKNPLLKQWWQWPELKLRWWIQTLPRLEKKHKQTLILTSLLCRHSVLVIVEVFSPEQERKPRVIFLLLFRHVFEVRSISSHKIGQFIYYIFELRLWN